MRAREIYGRYLGRFLDLASGAAANAGWESHLKDILRDFESEAAALEPRSARLLRNELGEQLEFLAQSATSKHARAALLAALKRIELGG
jgi:hypothetical protein